MTIEERQILVNQVAIMSALIRILNNSNPDSNLAEIRDLGKCATMTYAIINNREKQTK